MAATNELNTVLLTVTGLVTRDVGTASGTVSPGDLLELTADGEVLRHASAGGAHGGMVAVENTAFNKNISDDYADGDQVHYAFVATGMKCMLKVKANAAAITKGDFLESAGDGKVKVFAAGVKLFVAEETYDNSANGSVAWIMATKI